ncbi:MAG: RNA-binding protein [Thermoplasmata archaeon HGW-Thermoplasmata-1]|nr:MAG: RNA-binding protein [Thermoplasmata archaeon HGW-Thermoplasmata-1]
MDNLDAIATGIAKHLDEKDALREQALTITREMVRDSGEAIRNIHKGLCDEAAGRLENLIRSARHVTELLKDHGDLYHAGFTETAFQELVEMACVLAILKGEPLPEPQELCVTPTSYLLGLGDVIGELRRQALDALRKGDLEQADEDLQKMEAIYDCLIKFDYPSAMVPIRRKQDIARGLIEKTRGEVAVAAGNKKLEEKLDALRGFLDEAEGKKKPKEKKPSGEELDIDSVWKG